MFFRTQGIPQKTTVIIENIKKKQGGCVQPPCNIIFIYFQTF